MKRIIDHFLVEWKNDPQKKPLIIRGARQVGKTHSIRELGKTFPRFIEINLETNLKARDIFIKDVDINRIIIELSTLLEIELIPNKTLLFIDEIQQVPQAITALRYFYEEMPDLHVIAAGSLLEFALELVGAPVGRVSYLHMYPLSFIEFLVALEHEKWAKLILADEPLFKELHERLIDLVGTYLAIGGMPEAVERWRLKQVTRKIKAIHSSLLNTYIQDFNTYARKHENKYLSLVLNHAADQLSKKFMYSRLSDYRKREIEPAIELLEKAGIIYRVYRSSGQGIPIGSGKDEDDFKIIFLDVGLTQALLKFNIGTWILKPLETFVNKGDLVETFVGQELLAYSDPITRDQLFYWRTNNNDAEVDYLIQQSELVVPIEVKAGKSTRIISMHKFLQSHQRSQYGLRFWTENEIIEDLIRSYPLYAIAKPLQGHNEYLKDALEYLTLTPNKD